MGQAEQRNVEEQEVLYNMTGQTGSLMYMAPEVTLTAKVVNSCSMHWKCSVHRKCSMNWECIMY